MQDVREQTSQDCDFGKLECAGRIFMPILISFSRKVVRGRCPTLRPGHSNAKVRFLPDFVSYATDSGRHLIAAVMRAFDP
jgi:hypothetical protein